jgi:hypothetical protein
VLAGGDGTVGEAMVLSTTAGEVESLSIDTTSVYKGVPQILGHLASVTLTDTYWHPVRSYWHPVRLQLYP